MCFCWLISKDVYHQKCTLFLYQTKAKGKAVYSYFSHNYVKSRTCPCQATVGEERSSTVPILNTMLRQIVTIMILVTEI